MSYLMFFTTQNHPFNFFSQFTKKKFKFIFPKIFLSLEEKKGVNLGFQDEVSNSTIP